MTWWSEKHKSSENKIPLREQTKGPAGESSKKGDQENEKEEKHRPIFSPRDRT